MKTLLQVWQEMMPVIPPEIEDSKDGKCGLAVLESMRVAFFCGCDVMLKRTAAIVCDQTTSDINMIQQLEDMEQEIAHEMTKQLEELKTNQLRTDN